MIVFGLVFGLMLMGGAVALLTVHALLTIGLSCIAFGSLVGLPAGFYYHVVLYRYLRARGAPPAGWWWHPTRYHACLEQTELARTRPYFLVGGAGFLLIIIGSLVTALAMMGAHGF